MNVTFLGTGTSQGVPVIACDCPVCRSLDYRDKRLRVSVLVETSGKTFVIDTGPDFRQQMLRENVRKLDAVVYTHQHKDHTAGLDDVRAYNYLQKKDMPLYGRQEVLNHIKNEFYYAFGENVYPGVPRLQLNRIESEPFEIEGVPFIPIQVMHHRLPVLGFRVGDFTYITDANYISETEMDKIRGSKVVVVNALQREPHISHFTLSQAIELVQQLDVPQAYFTHMSHKIGLHASLEKELPENIHLAYDGLKLKI